MEIEFVPWPKIPRLRRGMVITEKIDGTNAAVGVISLDEEFAESIVRLGAPTPAKYVRISELGPVLVYAQSRTRVISPDADNFGFASWTHENAAYLAHDLGPGIHFGEWWGSGIQRRYGLDHKRFSLFNTHRWGNQADGTAVPFLTPGLGVVPVITEHTFSETEITKALDLLREQGSLAAPGFMQPEGIVVYLSAARQMFKVLLDNDEMPKGVKEAA